MTKITGLIFVIIGVLLLTGKLKAQDGIDTALFKQLKVKKMWVYVKLPLLPNKSLNDSCKVETYEMDTFGRIVYVKNALTCYGWSGSGENYYIYDRLNRVVVSQRLEDNVTTLSKYSYNKQNDIIKIVQTRPGTSDSFVTINRYTYNKKAKVTNLRISNIFGTDTTVYIMQYEYDAADNLKVLWTYTGDLQLMEKQTYDFTPVSKKLLEFSTETKLPKESFTRGWNYYNFDAQLSRTQFSNNTWTEFVYKDNGLLYRALNYNMESKLNSLKTYFYEFHEGVK